MNEKFNKLEVGLEIEFATNDAMYIFNQLQDYGIEFIVTGDSKYNKYNSIVIKPESTVKGFEINIPPAESLSTLSIICNIFKGHVELNENCCLHIHTEVNSKKDCDNIYEYYCEHEKEIIEDAEEKNLYNNLNRPASTKSIIPIKACNMNIYKAFETHHTVEHRIYKATFDYDDVCWCITQTKEIISKALNEKFKERKWLKAINKFREEN